MILVVATLGAYAQEGLNVAPYFSDSYATNADVTMISLSGKQLEGKGLTKYKSVSVTGNPLLADKISAAVSKDGIKAKSKEVSYKEGQLYFGFYSLGGSGSHRKYLLYLNRRPVGKEKTTLIYIEGSLDDEAVKKMIK